MKPQRPSKQLHGSGSVKTGRSKSRTKTASPTDAPTCAVEQALSVGRAIMDNYAGAPTSPLQAAMALSLSPGSDMFRLLCGTSLAYGLTSGSYYTKEISLTPLGTKILCPLEESDVTSGMREAVLKPRIFSDFVRKYKDSALPRVDIAVNVLTEMGVARERAASVHEVILENLRAVGFIGEIKGKQYLDMKGVPTASDSHKETTQDAVPGSSNEEASGLRPLQPMPIPQAPVMHRGPTNRRIFITHGKNKALIAPIKKLLSLIEMVPVVSAERQSVSKPVPDKVMDDMRSCGAAIIHIDDETVIVDREGTEHVLLNDNVLMEAWGAMALYGRRFVLLVKNGIRLPSNLQGLYEVRYSGETLDSDATLRLLEAINDIKNNPTPQETDAA